jgi:hypothetical protein
MKFLFILLFTFVFHPFHVSVTDLVYKEKKGFEIAVKLFTDDAELAIKNNYNTSVDLTKITDEHKKLVEKYVLSRFFLVIDKKAFKPVFIGYEVENDAIWCYLELNYPKKIKSLEVSNSLLIDTYSDQINLVNYNDLSFRFSEKETKKAIF